MSDILCPECGHKAEEHDHRTACGWGSGREDDDCDCRLDPSDVYIANLDDMTADRNALKAALADMTAERNEAQAKVAIISNAYIRADEYKEALHADLTRMTSERNALKAALKESDK